MAAIVRTMQMFALWWALSAGLFALLVIMPGNPVELLITANPQIQPADVARLKRLRGLDAPLHVQYWRWLWGHHEPKRAPVVMPIPPQIVSMQGQDGALVSLPITPFLMDPDHPVSPRDYLQGVRKRKPRVARELVRILADTDKSAEAFQVEELASHARRLAPKIAEELELEFRAKSAKTLRIIPLFGAEVRGEHIEQRFREPGVHTLWFIVEDRDGLQSAGRIQVYVPPHSDIWNSFLLDPEQNLQRSQDAEAIDAERQMAGSTEPAPDSPITETEQIEAALSVNRQLHVGALPVQQVDEAGNIRLRLGENIGSDGGHSDFSFRLAPGAPGTIDEGVYRHRFSEPGQKVIAYSVRAPGGKKSRGVFVVETGPLPDTRRFRPGFVFFFTGNTEALGYSSVYKRPVWSLLAGEPSHCGNGRLEPLENCDDGNRLDGDACSSACMSAGLSAWDAAEIRWVRALRNSGRIFNTLQLMMPALLLSLLLAIPLGILAAYRHNSMLDVCVNLFAFGGLSLPSFWLGMMMLVFFAEHLQLLPAGGLQSPLLNDSLGAVVWDRFRHTLLPTLVLTLLYTGRWLRFVRSAMLDVLSEPYIRVARAKGLSERDVVVKHAFRNALLPGLTVLALALPGLFGGALLVETVFSWPGLGRLQFDSVMQHDYYVAMVVFLLSAAALMLSNALVDVIYRWCDPRIRRFGERGQR